MMRQELARRGRLGAALVDQSFIDVEKDHHCRISCLSQRFESPSSESSSWVQFAALRKTFSPACEFDFS
jgi:hypothetical protein